MSSILAQRASASISPFVYPSINCTDLLVYLYLVENLFYCSPNEKKSCLPLDMKERDVV